MKIYISVDTEVEGESSEDNKKLMRFLQDNGHTIFRAPYVLSDNPDQYLKEKFGIEKDDYISQRKIHLKWVDEADLVIADITIPSEGRSMILQRAEDNSTPIILLNKNREKFGKVMKGLIKSVVYYKYTNIEDVINNLNELIKKAGI